MTELDDLIARMAALGDELRETQDGRRFFHAVYLRTTQAIAEEIDRGGFSDSAWMRRWDVAFADLYLDALEAERQGRPVSPPWRVAFDAAQNRQDLPPVRHVLLGLNAHINYDLPQAMVNVMSEADFDDSDILHQRQADHEHVDSVLSVRVGAESTELEAISTVSRWNPILRPINQAATRKFLTESRNKVWHNAIVLDQARRVGPRKTAERLAELARLCSDRVEDLARPGQILVTLAIRGFGVRLS